MTNVDGNQVNPRIADRHQAHLWLLDLERHRPDSLSVEPLLLDDSERDRLQAFSRQRDRQQYCLIRVAVRNVLSSYWPTVKPGEWRFSKNTHGKPAIAAPELTEPLHFNISHSGRWLAVAVSSNEYTGVDVEKVAERRSMMAIARRYFTDQEYIRLCDLAPEECCRYFFELWTLKEAYSKACGNALVPILGKLELSFPDKNTIKAGLWAKDNEMHNLTDWGMRLFAMPGYQLALAMRSGQGVADVNVRAFEIDNPLKPGAASESVLEPCRWGC